MAWLDDLLPGSFRGVPFLIEAHEAEAGGRRIHRHEYPGRDEIYAEDMGRKTREFEVEAYVLGDGYFGRRDRLIAACDEPGAGTLVHPYLGTRTVSCEGCTVVERSSEGGMARLTLLFVQAGPNVQPAGVRDTAEAVREAAAAMRGSAARQFVDVFDARGASLVAETAAEAVRYAAGEIATRAAAVLAADAAGLVFRPRDLADRMLGAIDGTADGLLRFLAGDAVSLPAVPGATPTRRRQASNQAALTDLVRSGATAEMARRFGRASYPDRTALIAARDVLGELLDARETAADADGFTAIRAVVEAAASRVDETLRGLPRVIRSAPQSTMPSLALAYEFYGDVDRAAEIAARNRLPRPGFVPAQPLDLLA